MAGILTEHRTIGRLVRILFIMLYVLSYIRRDVLTENRILFSVGARRLLLKGKNSTGVLQKVGNGVAGSVGFFIFAFVLLFLLLPESVLRPPLLRVCFP